MAARRQPRAATTHSRDAASADPNDGAYRQSISVDEMIARYPGEWVLMQVTAQERGWPSEGYLLAHGDAYEEVSAARSWWLDQVDFADGPLCLFDAYPLIRTGEELRQSLEELWAEVQNIEDYDPFRWPRV